MRINTWQGAERATLAEDVHEVGAAGDEGRRHEDSEQPRLLKGVVVHDAVVDPAVAGEHIAVEPRMPPPPSTAASARGQKQCHSGIPDACMWL